MLDETDSRILDILTRDGRISLKELAGAVGLSSPSTAERLRRLEERRVIHAFTIETDPEALGYPIQAIMRIRSLPGKLHAVQKMIEDIPQFIECDKVTGEDCFIARLVVRTIAQLDEILDQVAEKATTNTAIVKTRPVRRRLPPLHG